MSHNLHLNEQTGNYSFYSVREKAWHGLGHIADNYESSAEVVKKSGLDFTVAKEPNVHRIPGGQEIISTSSFYTYRTDTLQILGDKLGAEYHVVQNVEAFSFFDAIAGENGIYYETAGALGKGEQIFITAKLPGYIQVGKDDLIEKYLFLTNSHAGRTSVIAAFTPVRIVCNNTLNAALEGMSNTIAIKHTQNASLELREAHKIMGMINKLSPLYEQAFNAWANIPMDDADLKRFIQVAVAPNKEALEHLRRGKEDEASAIYRGMVDTILEYAFCSPTQQMDTTRGTLFGAYNTITGFYQNLRNFKDNKAKIKSIFYSGIAQTRTQDAFRLCEQFAKIGTRALDI